MELMALLYDILDKVRKEGLMSIERDIEAPEESAAVPQVPERSWHDHHMSSSSPTTCA